MIKMLCSPSFTAAAAIPPSTMYVPTTMAKPT
jgi:hypothetical protein